MIDYHQNNCPTNSGQAMQLNQQQQHQQKQQQNQPLVNISMVTPQSQASITQQQTSNELIGYYFGSISRETSEWILKNHANNLNGSYLLRSSGPNDDFVLSLLVIPNSSQSNKQIKQQNDNKSIDDIQQRQIKQNNQQQIQQQQQQQTQFTSCSDVLHYKIVETEDSFVALHGQIGNEKFATIDELIDKAQGVATKPRWPIQRHSLEHQILPPTYWGLSVDQVRLAILLKAKQWGFPLLSSIFQQTPQANQIGLDQQQQQANISNPQQQTTLNNNHNNNNNTTTTTTLNNETIRTLIYKSLHEFQPWFHGSISREEAERRIEEGQPRDGRFLVRERDNFSYAMCFSHKKTAKHYRIDILPTGELAIQDGHKFTSLMALVSHYTIMSDGLWCALTEACIRPIAQQQQQQLTNQISHQADTNNPLIMQQSVMNANRVLQNNNLYSIQRFMPAIAHNNCQNIYSSTQANANLPNSINQSDRKHSNIMSSSSSKNHQLVSQQSLPANLGLGTTIRVPIKEWLQTINNKWSQFVHAKHGQNGHQSLNNFLFGNQNPLNHHCRQKNGRHHSHRHHRHHRDNQTNSSSCSSNNGHDRVRKCKSFGEATNSQANLNCQDNNCNTMQNSYYLNHNFANNPIQQAIANANNQLTMATASANSHNSQLQTICYSNNNCNCCSMKQNQVAIRNHQQQNDLYSIQGSIMKNIPNYLDGSAAAAAVATNKMPCIKTNLNMSQANLGFTPSFSQSFVDSPLFAVPNNTQNGIIGSQLALKKQQERDSFDKSQTVHQQLQPRNDIGHSLTPVEEERLISPARSYASDLDKNASTNNNNDKSNIIEDSNSIYNAPMNNHANYYNNNNITRASDIYGSQLSNSTILANDNQQSRRQKQQQQQQQYHITAHSSTSSSSGQATQCDSIQQICRKNNQAANLISELKLEQEKFAASRLAMQNSKECNILSQNFVTANNQQHNHLQYNPQQQQQLNLTLQSIRPARTINSDLTSATKTNLINGTNAKPTIMCGQHAGSAYRYTNCPMDEYSLRLCTHNHGGASGTLPKLTNNNLSSADIARQLIQNTNLNNNSATMLQRYNNNTNQHNGNNRSLVEANCRISVDDLNLPHRSSQMIGPAAMSKFVQFQDGQCLRTHRDARSIQLAYLNALQQASSDSNTMNTLGNNSRQYQQQQLTNKLVSNNNNNLQQNTVDMIDSSINKEQQNANSARGTDNNLACKPIESDIDLIDCNDEDLLDNDNGVNFNFKYDPKLIKSSSIETLCSLSNGDNNNNNRRGCNEPSLDLDKFKNNSEMIMSLQSCWFQHQQEPFANDNQFNSEILNPIPIECQKSQEQLYNIIINTDNQSLGQNTHLNTNDNKNDNNDNVNGEIHTAMDALKKTQDLDELTTALLSELTTSLKAQVDLKNKRAGFCIDDNNNQQHNDANLNKRMDHLIDSGSQNQAELRTNPTELINEFDTLVKK